MKVPSVCSFSCLFPYSRVTDEVHGRGVRRSEDPTPFPRLVGPWKSYFTSYLHGIYGDI